jgi:hypothetical protein
MPTFKDTHGKEWLVKLDGPKIRDVRKACDVDLGSLDGEAFSRLDRDPVLLVDVLWILCRGQNNGVTDVEFGEALVGDPIEAATTALIDAVTDFFPTRKRLLLRSLADKQAAVTAKGTELALAKINDPALENRLLQAAEAKMTRELETLLSQWTGPVSALSLPASVESDLKG